MTAFSNRERILDVREERTGATPFEFREDATGHVVLRGYAATYEPYDCYGGPDAGGWVEQLRADSFKRTLAARPDVMLLLNHTGAPLARTKSGTMTLTADRQGLLVEARLDPSDPDVQALLPKMRRGDLDEMSFAFRVKDQEWDTNYTHRMITEVSLQKGDVSVVNYGMNPNTQVALAEGTVGALASLSHRQLSELRLDANLIKRAISNLSRVAGDQSKNSRSEQEEYSMEKPEEQYSDSCECGEPGCDCYMKEQEKKGEGCDCDCGQDPCVCDREKKSNDEDDEEDEEDEEGTEPSMQFDSRLANALDLTLISAYSLSDDSPEAQLKIKQARNQLEQLRGIKAAPTAVDVELANLRKECGLPDTARLNEAFDYLRANAADPGHWQTHLAVHDDEPVE